MFIKLPQNFLSAFQKYYFNFLVHARLRRNTKMIDILHSEC